MIIRRWEKEIVMNNQCIIMMQQMVNIIKKDTSRDAMPRRFSSRNLKTNSVLAMSKEISNYKVLIWNKIKFLVKNN